MSGAIPFSTDLATLAVFDPELLLHRVRGKETWWRVAPQTALEELASGTIALFPIGKEGNFRVSLRQADELTSAELELATGSVTGLGLKVSPPLGEVFVGAAERLPGEGRGERMPNIPGTGALLEVEPGDYTVTVHALSWRDEDVYYDEEGEILDSAPCDFVVLLAPREGPPRIPDALTPLIDLLPRAETKGSARVVSSPRRRRSSISDRPRRQRRSSSPSAPYVPAPMATPLSVPEEKAPFSEATVRDAFRDVLFGHSLHPPESIGLDRVELAPRDRSLMRHDVGIADLLKKATRVREQMRMLEAKINGNKGLVLREQYELQVPITRVYESLDELFTYLADT